MNEHTKTLLYHFKKNDELRAQKREVYRRKLLDAIRSQNSYLIKIYKRKLKEYS
ncbi:MAG: hypothetical protein ACOCV1_06795 [Bacillota bacterium]